MDDTPAETQLLAPVFLLGTGGPLLLEALAQAEGVWHLPLSVLDTIDERTDAAELGVAVAGGLVDRTGAPAGARRVRAVLTGDRLAASLRLLVTTYPDAHLVTTDPISAALGDALAPGQVIPVDLAVLLEHPADELRRLCAAVGVAYDQALRTPVEEAARRRRGTDGAATSGDSPYDSVYTPSIPAALDALGASLLVSTYQSGKLICARAQAGGLNTHFRDVDKPMGIAVGPGRFSLGTRTEVWDLRNMPEVAPKVEPAGTHDACYLPRHRHVTGDVAIHEMGYARGGELWFVNTAFSCLATLDADHSFVPRWQPPWISELAAGDRCHLNGMCVVDDEVRYVTALGRTDEPGGWRAGKATGGVLFDVAAGEVVAEGLSMPHSPRLADGRLWVLQSGLGALGVVDRDTGEVEIVCELPGFTRGMTIVDGFAFVGLSQIRESSTFGDLPIVHRLEERQCGVWMLDLSSGEVAGFLRFDDLVQEVFDVALLPGTRFPEIAEPGSSAVALSYQLP